MIRRFRIDTENFEFFNQIFIFMARSSKFYKYSGSFKQQKNFVGMSVSKGEYGKGKNNNSWGNMLLSEALKCFYLKNGQLILVKLRVFGLGLDGKHYYDLSIGYRYKYISMVMIR